MQKNKKKIRIYRKRQMAHALVHAGIGNVQHISQAEAIINAHYEHLRLALLNGESIQLPAGLGRLSLILRQGRRGIHPKTREPFDVPPTVTLRFRVPSALKKDLQIYCLDNLLQAAMAEEAEAKVLAETTAEQSTVEEQE